MKYFDLHCDTAYEIYTQKQPLLKNSLSVSLDGFDIYGEKAQVFAIWSENTKPAGEVYGDFFDIFENLVNEIDANSDRAVLCTDAETLKSADKRLKIIPAVEGSRLIENDISRLGILRGYGVRILTLAWEGVCPAAGAYDTDVGLTEFGREVVKECEALGIIIDVSHLSERAFWDLAKIAKKPFIASHSNSRAVCTHPRNLSDTQLRTIVSGGGIVGVNTVGDHLAKIFTERHVNDKDFTIETIVKHIVHMIEKSSEKNVCLGSDLDGTKKLFGLEKVEKMGAIGEYMEEHGAQISLVEDIYYNNAYNFFLKNL